MTFYEMSNLATPVGVEEHATSVPPRLRSLERLLSLNIFRGLTLIAMTVVNMPTDHHYTYAGLRHVRRNGGTIADLIRERV